ncbi:MAG: TorF family putative porin, partial [Thioalkalivibrio sp.]|nr:TorF family putative porin [Thioalkalivibrio sp.]
MKKLTRSALSAAVVAAVSTGGLAMTSTATAEVSANIGVVSSYFFRGFSESDGAAAVQGGIDFEDASGFYLGTWVSNVDFSALDPDDLEAPVDTTSYEIDLYAGFAGEFAGGFGYDVGYIYYAYPDAQLSDGSSLSADFGELYGELSYDMFYGGLAYTINDDDDSAL